MYRATLRSLPAVPYNRLLVEHLITGVEGVSEDLTSEDAWLGTSDGLVADVQRFVIVHEWGKSRTESKRKGNGKQKRSETGSQTDSPHCWCLLMVIYCTALHAH